MVPTKDRNHSAVLLTFKGEGILFDCGEGTQRQLKIADIPHTRIRKILITHWHGDHVLGLPGLIQTLEASNYERVLEVFGPPGTKKHMEHMFKAFRLDNRISINITEVEGGIFCNTEEYSITALPLEHSVPIVGFRFQEKDRRRMNLTFLKKTGVPEGPHLGKLQEGKDILWKGKKIAVEDATYIVPGKSIAYIVDTVPCKNAVDLAKETDLLIAEATYTGEMELKAEEYKHLTAKDAALLANNAHAKKLVLTHFSQRYRDTAELLENAKTYFSNVACAQDFMKLKI